MLHEAEEFLGLIDQEVAEPGHLPRSKTSLVIGYLFAPQTGVAVAGIFSPFQDEARREHNIAVFTAPTQDIEPSVRALNLFQADLIQRLPVVPTVNEFAEALQAPRTPAMKPFIRPGAIRVGRFYFADQLHATTEETSVTITKSPLVRRSSILARLGVSRYLDGQTDDNQEVVVKTAESTRQSYGDVTTVVWIYPSKLYARMVAECAQTLHAHAVEHPDRTGSIILLESAVRHIIPPRYLDIMRGSGLPPSSQEYINDLKLQLASANI